ncbi:MAG TPA: serine hydrolase domain-containing protein [Candidatus Baltobacteraceae bacterium]|jgi:D-alanyl-D-alanine carboxypeptidase|nr:serine hydrolase domain-containing protein [Candidatus Baltobacteraceae bacterium]
MIRFAAIFFAAVASMLPATPASDSALRAALQKDLDQYLSARAKPEHISAISLSISLHGQQQNINLTAGTTKYGGGGGDPAAPQQLWQIGSNTKAFTAAIILQLEAEGKLNINQTIGQFLPQYPAWKNITIHRLLDMTSGVPGYDLVDQMLADYAAHPKRNITAAQLIAYVYPGNPHAPAPTKGYAYSNTGYILAELIIEKVTHNTYTSELERRFLRSDLGLTSTYYSGTMYPAGILNRMVSGYFYSHDADNAGLKPLLGLDIHADSVSWMKSAGAIVSTPEDLTRWARALYTGPMLAPKQRAELFSLVSLKNGKPIKTTTPEDPRAFGLGVAQMTTPETGKVWFYEGMTLGYRMLHIYLPKQDAVIAFGLNSQPDSKQNQSGKLMISIFETLHKAGKI